MNEGTLSEKIQLFEVPGFGKYSENLIKSSTIEAQKIAFGKESVAETLEIPYNKKFDDRNSENTSP